MFDRFMTKSKEDQDELEQKLLKLQQEHNQLNEKFMDAQIEIDTNKYRENDQSTYASSYQRQRNR